MMQSKAYVKRRQFSVVANYRNKNEKASFIRKKKHLEKLVEQLQPISDDIITLQTEHNRVLQEIYTLRNNMLPDCYHPQKSVINGTCKFCSHEVTFANTERTITEEEWNAKLTELESLTQQANNLYDELLKLKQQEFQHLSEIVLHRKSMIADCIHPADNLVHYGTHIICKFCENKISLPRI